MTLWNSCAVKQPQVKVISEKSKPAHSRTKTLPAARLAQLLHKYGRFSTLTFVPERDPPGGHLWLISLSSTWLPVKHTGRDRLRRWKCFHEDLPVALPSAFRCVLFKRRRDGETVRPTHLSLLPTVSRFAAGVPASFFLKAGFVFFTKTVTNSKCCSWIFQRKLKLQLNT